MYEFLKKVPLFADLPEDDLARLCEMIDEVHLAPGEELFSEGSVGDKAYVIKEGQIEIVKASGVREVLLALRGPGEVIGEISLIEEAPRMASVRARVKSLLLAISHEQFEELLNSSPSAVRATLYTAIARWRSTEAKLRQSEKMAQLGTMSAGLAHELNNPAAAIQRGTEQIRLARDQVQTAELQLAHLSLSKDQLEQLQHNVQVISEKARQPDTMNPLDRADREEELEDWLDESELGDQWEHVSTLVSMGYGPQELGDLANTYDSQQLPAVIAWLANTFQLNSLLEEVHEGAARISSIVKALKSYVYLDQAPVQAVDVHEGLDNTLILLRNKLKDGIQVERDYAPDLPKIQAYGSELNQVWTNLIDNAADAMDGKGELVLRTKREGDWVVVDVQDNGQGIPEENLGRIFDPFFTTKPPGKGTGLGLDISYNIVVNKHRGDINVYSRPGKTIFRVKLPINPQNGNQSAPVVDGIRFIEDDKLANILKTVRNIAVVGISQQPHLPAYSVPAYLQSHGYQIIPVNPHIQEVLGQKAYSDLLSVPDPVDEVLIFRRSEDVPSIVDQAIQIGAKVVWMQEGIIHRNAAAKAREAGLEVVMDTCMRTTHRRLMGKS